jgi:hypothetical protein
MKKARRRPGLYLSRELIAQLQRIGSVQPFAVVSRQL